MDHRFGRGNCGHGKRNATIVLGLDTEFQDPAVLWLPANHGARVREELIGGK